MSNKVIPISILTGFLGAGKTTLVNKILEQNPGRKFGLIINEFGEEGIDGSLIQVESDEDIVEISNGCLCCVARGDLLKSAQNLIKTGQIDYLLIETSGLAEPMPIAQTFMADNLDGQVILDGVICLVDAVNHYSSKENFRIAIEQVLSADIIVLNKLQEADPIEIEKLKKTIKEVNPYAYFLDNYGEVDTKLLLETGKWTFDKVVNQDNDGSHKYSDDNHACEANLEHEHEEVDEFVFVTEKKFDLDKFQEWLMGAFPQNIIRSKGFIRFNHKSYEHFLFQMVGAKKMLIPFTNSRELKNAHKSRIVFIGKDLDEQMIRRQLEVVLINET